MKFKSIVLKSTLLANQLNTIKFIDKKKKIALVTNPVIIPAQVKARPIFGRPRKERFLMACFASLRPNLASCPKLFLFSPSCLIRGFHSV